MPAVATHESTTTRAIEKARSSERLTAEDGRALFGLSLQELGRLAAMRRDQFVPARDVTYLVDRNINYTNVCITDCQFCAFYRPPGHAEGYTLSNEQIASKIDETIALGGTRILLQGGHNPGLRLAYYVDLMRFIRGRYPDLAIDGFSPSEIDHLATLEGLSTAETLRTLRDAGLTGLPGGGAEILDDDIRSKISPKKQRTAGWLETMSIAQSLGLVTTASMVIGFGETIDHRLSHLGRIRDLEDASRKAHGQGFTAFISWTAQLKHNSLGRSSRVLDMGATAFEYLKVLALSRLYLDNFAHIATSWPTLGEKIAEVSLLMGADDFGSTMLEENVVSASGTTRTSMSVADIQRHVRNAGFTPVQRNSRYETVKRFE
ncbi:MAG: CofH family radical SAM protein [Acidobacteriota bacterium]